MGFHGLQAVSSFQTAFSFFREVNVLSVSERESNVSFFTQELQTKVEAEEAQLWTAVDKSYQRLVETLHQGAAQALGDKVDRERERSVVQKERLHLIL